VKITLPEDGWALIRDPRTLTERLSARIEDAQFRLMDLPIMKEFTNAADAERIQSLPPGEQMRLIGPDGFQRMREVKWTTILVYVTEWSYGEVTEDVLMDEVPSYVVNLLSEEIGNVIKATGGPNLDTSVNPDPASPTRPSKG